MSKKGFLRFFFVLILLLLIVSIPQKIFASQILFQDDFNDGNANGWEEHVGPGGSWIVQNGEYVGRVNQNLQHIASYALAGDVSWTDYILELKIKGTSGVDKVVRFRYSHNDKYYFLNLRGNPFNDLAVGRVGQNGWLQFLPVPNSQNTWSDIKVELKENNIKIYVNGELKFDFTDNNDAILNGKIGLEIWPGAAAYTTINRFDDVKVTEIESGPEPFLDLPWDYSSEENRMYFREAALAIQSYFDHEYPLLDVGLLESPEAQNSVTNFEGKFRRNDLNYSKHDGYDWLEPAGVHNGDPVLAAASGIATFFKADKDNGACGSLACGNVVVIDHQNGYQTRYYHLQDNDPIAQSITTPRHVERGEQIGKVGSTGTKSDTPHIHFSVLQDKNGDGDFDDNRPDGITDPFGWHPKNEQDEDPWPLYQFEYKGVQRTGNQSHYLWLGNIYGFTGFWHKDQINTITVERYNYSFSPNTFAQDVQVEEKGGPAVKTQDNFVSFGSISIFIAKDILGNLITNLLKPFLFTVDFGNFNLIPYKPDTLSIYSSNDGENWTKEDTTIDWENKVATAEIDHLSQFTLMAERLDTIAPTTTATLFGDEGDTGWFRSDVEVTLEVQDNEGGLGAYYIGYRVDDDYFKEYTEPITISREGNHKVEFYAVDNDQNIEEIKSVEFNIDKTKPTGSISASPEKIWPPNNKAVDVIINGNSYDNNGVSSIVFDVEDEYDEVEPLITSFGETIRLKAKRNGNDKDGRYYIIKLKVIDFAGNASEYTAHVIVLHDQSKNN